MLRKEESRLVSRLRDLRLEARHQVLVSSRSSSSHKSSGNKLASRKHSLLFWERAALQQLQHRQRSEQENHRLKALLQRQLRHARELQQALSRRQVVVVGSPTRAQLLAASPTNTRRPSLFVGMARHPLTDYSSRSK